jgi:hypothetical protein
MNSWETVKLFGSAVLPRTIHLHQLATAGAMLTCVAVALNVGPFAKVPKTDLMNESARGGAVRTVIEPNALNAIPPRELQASAPLYGPQLATELAGNTRPITPIRESLLKSSSRSGVGVAPMASQSALPEDASDDAKEKSARDETASVDLATHQPDDANSDLAKSAAIVGVWAPNPGTCSARDFREGTLPAVISADGAWAGETFCVFSNKKQTETGWSVVAKCSNPKERWTANVRLTVKDNRLTWTSKRGTQAYTRCAPDVLMTAAR